MDIQRTRPKTSKNECTVELVVRDGERDVDGNSGGALLPNSVCMSCSTYLVI
jgi:hypothetical protein